MIGFMFNFEFARIRLEFLAVYNFESKYLIGQVFNGILNRNLKNLVCLKPDEKSCEGCKFLNVCPYIKIASTDIIPTQFSKYALKPYPNSNKIEDGTTFCLDITLLGKTLDYWEFVLNAFPKTIRFKNSIFVLKNAYFYNPIEEKYFPIKSSIQKFESKNLLQSKTNKDTLKITVYPAYLTYVKNNTLDKDSFARLVLSRVYTVAQDFGIVTRRLYVDSESFYIKEIHFEPIKLDIFSKNQPLEGYILLEGDLSNIYPYLKILENISIGKFTTSGFGNIVLS
mgnify:CR=1 FL=1